MTESAPRKIGYWESMGKIVMSDPMKDTVAKLDVHYATKQEFAELEATTGNTSYNTIDESELDKEVPDITFKHDGPVIGTFDNITDEEGEWIIKATLNEMKFMDDIKNQDGADDLLERISKAVPEIMECLESGRVDRAGLKLEEVKLDLDDYNEGDVS